jgi:hypothetical protein
LKCYSLFKAKLGNYGEGKNKINVRKKGREHCILRTYNRYIIGFMVNDDNDEDILPSFCNTLPP